MREVDAPETRWAPLARARLRYRRTGGAGPALLLIHEMGGSLESWDAVVPALAPHFDVICPDLRGSGKSQAIRAPLAVCDLADDLLQLLDHLALTAPVDVAGVALGGCIGLLFAARNPDRVRRLVAINPPTNAEGASGEILLRRAASAEASGIGAVVDAALGRSYPEEVMGDGSDYQRYRARFLTNDPVSYAFILRALAAVDFTGVLERIVCPTLFLSGRFDKVRPPAQISEVSKRVRGAQFRETAGGHILSVQAPGVLAREILAFLEPAQSPGAAASRDRPDAVA